MKSFKIIALQLIDQQQAIEIPLTDGLVINMESEDGDWIIEAYIDKKFKERFQAKWENKDTFEIRVVITHPGNDPAPFTVKIITIREIGSHISVLFQGTLRKRRNEYPELLLNDLLKEGYSGDLLMTEFKKRMRAKQK
ncbi:YwpF family protein [Bacillus subtilis]|uniref:YwpF family protein n=1 Tax=Lederbergia ruris TaxID=217495 RepID=UPI001786C8DD